MFPYTLYTIFETIFVQLTPFKFGFDSWDVAVQDENLETTEKRQHIGNEGESIERNSTGSNDNSIDNKENTEPSGADLSSLIDGLPIYDSSNIQITRKMQQSTIHLSDENCEDSQSNNGTNAIESFSNDDSHAQINSEKPNCEHCHKPVLFSGKYFKMVFKDSAITRAECMTCHVVYSATKNTTSNFITHLKVGHWTDCFHFYEFMKLIIFLIFH